MLLANHMYCCASVQLLILQSKLQYCERPSTEVRCRAELAKDTRAATCSPTDLMLLMLQNTSCAFLYSNCVLSVLGVLVRTDLRGFMY